SVYESTPIDSITSKTIHTVDTISPHESVASSTQSNSSAKNVADALYEIPAEKRTALPPLSAKGPEYVVNTTTASGFFPRLIAPITRRQRSKKALIITLLLLSLLL